MLHTVAPNDPVSRLAELRAMHGMGGLHGGSTRPSPSPSTTSSAPKDAFAAIRALKARSSALDSTGRGVQQKPSAPASPPAESSSTPKKPVREAVILRHRARCWNCGKRVLCGDPSVYRNHCCLQWYAAEGYEWIKWDDYVPKQEEPLWNE